MMIDNVLKTVAENIGSRIVKPTERLRFLAWLVDVAASVPANHRNLLRDRITAAYNNNLTASDFLTWDFDHQKDATNIAVNILKNDGAEALRLAGWLVNLTALKEGDTNALLGALRSAYQATRRVQMELTAANAKAA